LDATRVYDYHDRLYPFRVYTHQSDERFGLMVLNGKWEIKLADGIKEEGTVEANTVPRV
jgi:hypothetical protein